MNDDDIFDLMVDKPYLLAIVGALAYYLGSIKIISGIAIFYALNYVMMVMGIFYIIFSIVFTIIKIDEKKNPMDTKKDIL